MMKKIFIATVLATFSLILGGCENESPLDNQEIIESIVGKWKCQDYDGSVTRTYEVSVTKDNDKENGIIIDNFNNFGTGKSVKATVDGSILIIENQNVEIYTVKGNGEISNNYQRIEWKYTLNDGYSDISMTATFTPAVIAKKSVAR